jgi:2-dehydropantoate 2-reductase
MQQSKPRIVVVGPGAIGGATAALAAAAGHAVTLVCKDPALATKVSTEGLLLRGARGSRAVVIPAVGRIEELTGTFDIALVAVKSPDLADAARRLLPFLGKESLVVSLQNGMCMDALAEVVGTGRAVGCVVGWGSTMVAPGEIDVTSEGEFVVGMASGGSDERLPALKAVLESAFPARIVDDIFDQLYSKLIINSCITSVGALCGLTLGRMMGRRDARSIFIAVMREAVATADALGIRVPPYGGRLDYYRFLDGSGLAAGIRRHVFLILFGFAYRRLTSSSLQSLRRGRRTEIENFNGYISRRAVEKGVAAPVNDRIVALVKEIEEGKRRIAPENLRAIRPR